MNIIDRYIARALFSSLMTVMLVLLGLFSFFTFADELGDVGKGTYDVWGALFFSLSSMPAMAYQLFPTVALIGTLAGLGGLASNSELTAIRAAGVSLNRIIWAVLKVGIVSMAVVFVLGEYIAPQAERFAETQRSIALSEKVSLQTDTGLWMRDGDRFVNIAEVNANGRVGGVNLFQLDDQHRLVSITRANTAQYFEQDQTWQLDDVEVSTLSAQGISKEAFSSLEKTALLSPSLLGVVMTSAESMSLSALSEYISFQDRNGLDASQYRQAFWSKAISPFATLTMVLLAIPFIFGPLRSQSAGHRILLGTMVGIGFHLLSQVIGFVGLVYAINPIVASLAPTLVFFVVAVVLLRRVY